MCVPCGPKRRDIPGGVDEGCYSRDARIPVLARRDVTGLLSIANLDSEIRSDADFSAFSAGRCGSAHSRAHCRRAPIYGRSNLVSLANRDGRSFLSAEVITCTVKGEKSGNDKQNGKVTDELRFGDSEIRIRGGER